MSQAPMVAPHPWVKRTSLRCRSHEASMTIKFSPDDSIIASGHYDGTLVAFDTSSLINKFEINVTPRDARGKLPITSLSFRPGTKSLLLLTCSNGMIERYDWKSMEKVTQFMEEDNETYHSDYSPDATSFATCGRDAAVRVYDDTTCDLVRTFAIAPEFPTNPAALRLYSVKYCPTNASLIATCGWGNAIHLFDTRVKLANVSSNTYVPAAKKDAANAAHVELFGPVMAGDCLDFMGNTILTASRRLDNRIQLWDIETQKATEVSWPVQAEFMPNTAKLSPDAEYIACGGGGDRGFKDAAWVLDRKSGRVVVDAKFEKTVSSCAFAYRESLVAFGDGDGQVHLFENRFAHRKP